MNSTAIHLKGRVNDSLPSMRLLVEKLAPLRGLDIGDHALIDLSQLRHIGPAGLVMTAGSALEASVRKVDVPVRSVDHPPSLAAFLEFSGFNHWMLGTAMPPMDHPKNNAVPLRRYDQSDHRDPEPFLDLISRFAPVSDDLRISLGVAINECIQNVEDHARSPIGAIGCGRFATRRGEIRVTLIDWGVGILNSLRRRYPEIHDSGDALRRVLRGGYSARTKMNNQGRGMDNLRAVVTEAVGGDLFIASGDAAVEIRGGRPPRYWKWRSAFAGTAICFTLPVRPRRREPKN